MAHDIVPALIITTDSNHYAEDMMRIFLFIIILTTLTVVVTHTDVPEYTQRLLCMVLHAVAVQWLAGRSKSFVSKTNNRMTIMMKSSHTTIKEE
jgi:hypothetical protein